MSTENDKNTTGSARSARYRDRQTEQGMVMKQLRAPAQVMAMLQLIARATSSEVVSLEEALALYAPLDPLPEPDKAKFTELEPFLGKLGRGELGVVQIGAELTRLNLELTHALRSRNKYWERLKDARRGGIANNWFAHLTGTTRTKVYELLDFHPKLTPTDVLRLIARRTQADGRTAAHKQEVLNGNRI
jgi:hypothetical protein